MTYTELQVSSNFSFLRGASHPYELVEQAVANGQMAVAITDRNSFAGIVRGHIEAKSSGIRLITGVYLELLDGPSLLAYPTDKESYAQLCNLLTLGNRRAEKGNCHLYKADVYAKAKGTKFIIVPPDHLNSLYEFEPDFIRTVQEYKEVFGSDCYLAACRHYRKHDAKWLFQLQELASLCSVPMVATNNVYYHHPSRRELQDILTCIREKCTIENAGYRLHANAERHMKSTEEMNRLFRQYPDAIRRTQEIEDACRFSLDSLSYEYPEEITTDGRTPDEELAMLTWNGARERFSNNIPPEESKEIEAELEFIKRKQLARYFLTVEDIVRESRRRRILCQGRGSAANSRTCYYTGITAVDPTKSSTFFSRFMSDERNEPPDIDVDFEHERREEIIQYLYQKYGRDRVAIVSTVIRQHKKGAVGDVGRVMGLSRDTVSKISNEIETYPETYFFGNHSANPALNENERKFYKVMELVGQMLDLPRQLGQHTGGFVITAGKLSDLCPIYNARMDARTCVEWDKDDIDAMGFIKVDILSIGMLTAIRKTFDLVEKHYGRILTLQNIPQDDPAVFDMICAADTIGVFQIESRAQQAMLPRMQPRCQYDLVIEVALVRPGPIQGDMVHPYLERRNAKTPISYPSKAIEKIVGRTLGIPLFQEQVMQISVDAAGFTSAESDALRRSMAKREHASPRLKKILEQFKVKLIDGMIANSYSREYAELTLKQIAAFGAYGFPESHSASYAILAYISAWLKRHFPAAHVVGILNSLPMGCYSADQLVTDAQRHNVKFLPIDVNYSQYDYTLEELPGGGYAVRVGFRQIAGIREAEMFQLIGYRAIPYRTVHSILDATVKPATAISLSYISITTLKRLASADAFGSLGLDRRKALWEVSALDDRPIGLFKSLPSESIYEKDNVIPDLTPSENVAFDYSSIGLSLKGHPVSFLRPNLRQLNNNAANELSSLKDGQFIHVAGLLRSRQRPETANGTCFIQLEDETGTFNLIAWASVFSKYRKAICNSKLMMVSGHVQIQGIVIHVIVQRCWDLSWLLARLAPVRTEDLPVFGAGPAQVSEAGKRQIRAQELKQASLFPEARNFR